MTQNYDVKQEWDKTKKQLIRFGKEVGELVRKGEDEIIALSQKGKIQIESTTTSIKKEKLYYQIGKEYVALGDQSKPSRTLKKLLDEYHKLEREQKSLSTKLKRKTTKKASGSAVRKRATKTKRKTVTKSSPRKGAKKKTTKKT